MEMSTMHKTHAQTASGCAQDAPFRNDRVIREYLSGRRLSAGRSLQELAAAMVGAVGHRPFGQIIVGQLLSALTSMPRTEGGLLRFTYWKVPNG